MKAPIFSFLAISLVALMALPGKLNNASAGVILDPDPLATVEGIVGLDNETFGAGSIQSSAAGVAYSASFGSDGQFTVTAVAEASLALQVYMNSFQESGNATLRQYVYNQSFLIEGETRNVDLRRASGRIAGNITVIGGSLSNFNMRSFSSDSSVPEQFTGSVSVSEYPYVAQQPMPPLTGTRVNGSVSILADSGCSVSRGLSAQYVDVIADSTTDVHWTVDVSSANCDTGSLQGSLTIAGLDGLNADVTEQYRRVYVRGPVFRYQDLDAGETAYNFSDLPVGIYSIFENIQFNAPYTSINTPAQSNAFEIRAGEISTYDKTLSLGTAHGGLELTGSWGLEDLNYAQVYATPSGNARVDLSTGEYDLVLIAGNPAMYYNFFTDSSYDPVTGDSWYWYTQMYRYGDNRTAIELIQGDRMDVGDQVFETSQALVVFQVAQQEGQPEAQISRLVVRGPAFDYDSNTGALLSQNYIYQDDRRTANSSFNVLIRGLPGSHQMQATGYGTDGRQYRATFELMLGAPDSTPEGSNIEQVFTNDAGEEVVSLSFDNVTEGGETTMSEVSIGPNAPRNFKIFKVGGQPHYFDISTTAVFDGTVEVCINYDDNDIGDPSKEADMVLAHYNAATDSWDFITKEGYPDTINNTICGITDSFSIFAILEEDITDVDEDGVADDEDNCPVTANSDQADFDDDEVGDACDVDNDGDNVPNASDLCPDFYATDNSDLDMDGIGDPCDDDKDGDMVINVIDNCPVASNPDQADFDSDTVGDECDTDDDGDDVLDFSDSCPGTALGTLTDLGGCSSHQRFESACPSDGLYRNHGKYVSCVAKEAERQVDMGLITEEEKDAIVSSAGQSLIGKKS